MTQLEIFFRAIIDFITDIIAAIQRFMGMGTPIEDLESTAPHVTDESTTV